MTAPQVWVIGAGPAGLMAAETLARAGVGVVMADAAPSPARKFQLAGRGGLNLTHSEPLPVFLSRYGGAREAMAGALEAFPPEALRDWCAELGEPTFVGSSGRVFPKSFKSTALLRAWLRALQARGVVLHSRWRWRGFAAGGGLRFTTPEGDREVEAATVVLALGGASWPRLGGDGAWVEILRAGGVEVTPLRAANSGVLVDWSPVFRERFAGAPIKAARWSLDGVETRAEAVVTQAGLEGGAIYALGAALRARQEAGVAPVLSVDLKPDVSAEALALRLQRPAGASLSTFLRKAAHLPPVAIGLLREAGEIPKAPEALAARLKACPVAISGFAPIARAISCAGGVAWGEIDAHFMLRKRPGVFVAGEMIDWEAPTGGYLLQGAFSTGVVAGRAAAEWALRPGGREGDGGGAS